jgi:hypothetical protein
MIAHVGGAKRPIAVQDFNPAYVGSRSGNEELEPSNRVARSFNA